MEHIKKWKDLSKEDRKQLIMKAIEVMRRDMPEVVKRHKIKEYRNFPFTRGYLQNRDSEGTGPGEAFYLGRYLCYFRDRLLEWTEKELLKDDQPF